MTDIRVTQAGRQAITQEDADVRVTQAGRQVATQEDADLRVTQLGRQVLGGGAVGDLRVTQLGRLVLLSEPRPSQPYILTPFDGEVIDEALYITYSESIDPLGGDVTYTCEYKKTSDSTWIPIFTDREGNEPYVFDASGLDDDDYDMRLWSETVGYTSFIDTGTFTVHNGAPTAPVITAPFSGQVWTQTTNDLEWEDATDPQGDPLTYNAQYRLVDEASTWTPLFTDDTSPYAWDMTSLPVGDYEVQVIANDGVGDGPPGSAFFTVSILDEPAKPALSVIRYTEDLVEVEIREYSHPQSRPWQATKYELIPFAGSWDNPVISVTTTDPDEALNYVFEGLTPGFQGVIRATFQDNVGTWGDPSNEAFFALPGATGDWERRYSRDGLWYPGGRGLFFAKSSLQCCMDPFPYFYAAQATDAVVPQDSETLGSFIMSGWVMIDGCNCGIGKQDSELRNIGIGVFSGNADQDNQQGVRVCIATGASSLYLPVPGTVEANIHVEIDYEPSQYPWTDYKLILPVKNGSTVYGNLGIVFTNVQDIGQPNPYGINIGRFGVWTSIAAWYKITLWVERNIGAGTTRIRARVDDSLEAIARGYEGWWPAPHLDGWHIDETVNRITPCGQPGFFFAEDATAQPYGNSHFRWLEYTALRDVGQDQAGNVGPLTPWEEPGPGICSPVTEDPLPTPVLFPAPPNGDVEEEIGYVTDVITARDDSEQRIALHEDSVRSVRWTATLPTPREIAHLQALIFENQAGRWGVPMWMDATTLLADLSSSAGSIPASSIVTTGRRFDEVDYVAIWTDQFTCELKEAVLEADGSITLGTGTVREYQAHHTQIIPVRIGRMPQRLLMEGDAPHIGDLDVRFVLEAIDG